MISFITTRATTKVQTGLGGDVKCSTSNAAALWERPGSQKSGGAVGQDYPTKRWRDMKRGVGASLHLFYLHIQKPSVLPILPIPSATQHPSLVDNVVLSRPGATRSWRRRQPGFIWALQEEGETIIHQVQRHPGSEGDWWLITAGTKMIHQVIKWSLLKTAVKRFVTVLQEKKIHIKIRLVQQAVLSSHTFVLLLVNMMEHWYTSLTADDLSTVKQMGFTY